MLQNGVEIFSIVIALVFLAFFGVILWKILTNQIDLRDLVNEPAGKASLARFQMLLFTFVIAGLFLLLSVDAGQFVDIPDGVLVLLGISSGSYVIAKAVGNTKSEL